MNVVFTGGNYYKLEKPVRPHAGKSDFIIVTGRRWIKSRQRWSSNILAYALPNHYVTLTDAEIEAQGLHK